jgi:hypothetical protein
MAVENNNIEYAIRIYTDATSDIVDLFLYNGEIRFITGQVNTGLTFEDTSPADDFYKGMLIMNPLKSVGSKIDISLGGEFNSLNSCTVTLNNSEQYATKLLANEVYLQNSKVQIYAVIEGVLYSRFGGKISGISYNERNLVLTCKDTDELDFKNVPENSDTQLAIGNIKYLKLKRNEEKEDIQVNSFYANKYFQSTHNGAEYPRLELIVDLAYYKANLLADSLKGQYVRPKAFGEVLSDDDTNDAVKIIASTSYIQNTFGGPEGGVPGAYQQCVMVLILEKPFDDIKTSDTVNRYSFVDPTTFNESPTLYNFDSSVSKTIFDVIKMRNKYYISDGDIEEVDKNSQGDPLLYIYNEDLKKYTEVDATVSYEDTTDRPFINLVGNSDGFKINKSTKVEFTDCKYKRYDTPPFLGTDFLYGSGTFIQGDPSSPFYNKYVEIQGPSPDIWYSGNNLIDDDYTTTVAPTSPFKCKKEYVEGVNISVYGNKIFSVENGVIIRLEVSDDFRFDEWDEVRLGFGASFSGDLNNSSKTNLESELNFYFDTLSVVYNHGLQNYTTGDTIYDSDVSNIAFSKLIANPTNRLSFKLFKINEESGDSIASQVYTDSIWSDVTDSYATIAHTTFANDNPTFTNGKQIYGNVRNLVTDPETSVSNSYGDLDNELSDTMVFANDPVVTDYNGKRYIYLHAHVDPLSIGDQNSPNIEEYLVRFKLYNLHLICNKVISTQDIFASIKGEVAVGKSVAARNVYDTFKLLLEKYNSFTNVEYTNLEDQRSTWDCARLVTSPTGSKSLIKNLALQSFVGVYTNRFGNLELDPFLDDIDFDADGNAVWKDPINSSKRHWTHDGTNIIKGSITNVTQTNVSKVYNDLTLNYNKDYSLGEFTKTYYVTKTEDNAFPFESSTRTFNSNYLTIASGQWATDTSDPKDASTVYLHDTGASSEYAAINQLEEGAELKFTTADPSIFYIFEIVTKSYSSNVFTFGIALKNAGSGNISDTTSSTVYIPDGYSSYSNVPSYTDARAFWENAHGTYNRMKILNKLSDSLSNCEWYRDVSEYGSETGVLNSSIHFYMEKLIEWVTRPKNMINYSIPLNEDNIDIELLDRVTFTDVLVTDDSPVLGFVTKYDIDTKNYEIKLEITTVPGDLVPVYRVIDELPDNIDGSIDEQPVAEDPNVDEDFILWD